MFKLLRQRNFGLLWFAGLISMIGDWVLFIALPIYTYNLTHSSLATGIMFMVGTLPRILFGSIAGVYVDRWDRQRTMVVADWSRVGLILLLLLVRSADSIWIVYLVAFTESIVSQFFGPAENALLPQLVDESQLVTANSLNSLNNNLARLAGPALGGILLGSFGFQNVVLIDSLSFLLSGIMIVLIVQPSLGSLNASRHAGNSDGKTPPRVWHDWLAGLRVVCQSRVVAVIFLVMALAGIGEGFFNVMFVIFIRQNLGGGALEFGWLTSAQAVGGLIGSLLVGWLGNRILASRLTGLRVFNGILILVMVNLASLPVALSALLLAGLPLVASSVGIDTLLQRYVTDRYRGRVFGALWTTISIFILLGQGTSSVLGDRLGAVRLLDLKGVIDIAAGLLGFFMLYKVKDTPPKMDPA
jgi:MFS family permease